MRRRFRLTGREEIPSSTIAVSLTEQGDHRFASLNIVHPEILQKFPSSAQLGLRFEEDKQVERLDCGTIGKPKSIVKLGNPDFRDPSCQIRVTDIVNRPGSLLATSRPRRLEANQASGNRHGILNFQHRDLGNRVWKLEIQENDSHPVLFVNKDIPVGWAGSNPVFLGSIFPAVIHLIFEEILDQDEPKDIEWMKDWLVWSQELLGSENIPIGDENKEDKRNWIDGLIDTFCEEYKLSKSVMTSITKD